MSYDIAIWSTHKKLTDAEAGQLYRDLCSGTTDGVDPSSAIDRMYLELTTKHPQIDDVPEENIDDMELCPWSIAFDRSPGHLIISCVWSKAEYVDRLLRQLAVKYELAFFDPQLGRVVYPAGS